MTQYPIDPAPDPYRMPGVHSSPAETRRYRIGGLAEAHGYVIPTSDFYLPYLQLVTSGSGGGGEARERIRSCPLITRYRRTRVG